MADVPAGWRLVPRLLLRHAGFGFDLLDGLTDPAVAEPAARYRIAVRELESVREHLLKGTVPAAVDASRERADRAALRALSKARAAVGRRQELPAALSTACPGQARIDDYRAAYAALQAAEAALLAAVTQDLADRPARLRKLVDPPVLDALLQLAPSFYDGVIRWLACGAADDSGFAGNGSARDRAMVRRMYLYLQRLAAKNETTSFFGPLVHGVVGGAPADGDVSFGWETTGVPETRVFMAFWAVCALARRMAADPLVGPAIPVTRVAACRMDGQALTLADGRRARLTRQQARLLAAVDGHRSPDALAKTTGLEPADVANWLARFERLGVVRTWPEPASTAIQPFEQLLADAREFAAHTPWPERLAALWTRVQDFAAAADHDRRRGALDALESEFTGLTRAEPRRGGGQMYADRLIAYLESHGDLSPVYLGGGLARTIERELAPVLDVGARHGELLHHAHQELARAILREAGARCMRYDEFIRRIGRASANGALHAYLGPVEEFTAALTGLIESSMSGFSCTLEPADLRRLGVPGQLPRFASPDLLIRRGADGPALVLGEVHPYVFAWGSQELFCPDPEGLRESFSADLSPWGGKTTLAAVVHRRRHKGLVTESFPGRFIEVTAVATRSRQRAVAITDLLIEARDDRVALREARGDLVLYAGEDDHPHLMAFAPPPASRFPQVWLGDRAPRITVGRLVAQRAAWRLDGEELAGGRTRGDGMASFRAVQRMRALRGLPRWVYAHVPGEPKPLCVDLDSPLAAEALASVVCSGGPGPVTIREMLPEPEALWLRRGGQPVTSELRLAMIRSGS
jgi:DNA-binding MarR family transcriptional regulator